jgi:hypothetical protein
MNPHSTLPALRSKNAVTTDHGSMVVL